MGNFNDTKPPASSVWVNQWTFLYFPFEEIIVDVHIPWGRADGSVLCWCSCAGGQERHSHSHSSACSRPYCPWHRQLRQHPLDLHSYLGACSSTGAPTVIEWHIDNIFILILTICYQHSSECVLSFAWWQPLSHQGSWTLQFTLPLSACCSLSQTSSLSTNPVFLLTFPHPIFSIPSLDHNFLHWQNSHCALTIVSSLPYFFPHLFHPHLLPSPLPFPGPLPLTCGEPVSASSPPPWLEPCWCVLPCFLSALSGSSHALADSHCQANYHVSLL